MAQAGVAQESQPDDLAALSFDRTIDRRKVHRSAVSEVFITDVRALGDNRVALAAQLPTCHAYFNDHHPAAGVDPLLIMEVCRQAGLATAYELGVSTDVVLVTGDWDLRVAGPGPWGAGGSAIDLCIESSFEWTRVRRGRPRAGTCRQRVFAAGRPIASLHATSQLLDHEELEILRTAQRGSPPPRTADMVAGPDPELVPPPVVGRRSALNVVLAGLVRGAGEASARVALPLANRALFDHSYDHVTMQVLIEAARQLAVAVAPGPPGGRHLARLAGRFVRFAELDSTVTVRGAAEAAGHESRTLVEQDGELVAELQLTMTPTDRNGHG